PGAGLVGGVRRLRAPGCRMRARTVAIDGGEKARPLTDAPGDAGSRRRAVLAAARDLAGAGGVCRDAALGGDEPGVPGGGGRAASLGAPARPVSPLLHPRLRGCSLVRARLVPAGPRPQPGPDGPGALDRSAGRHRLRGAGVLAGPLLLLPVLPRRAG